MRRSARGIKRHQMLCMGLRRSRGESWHRAERSPCPQGEDMAGDMDTWGVVEPLPWLCSSVHPPGIENGLCLASDSPCVGDKVLWEILLFAG